MSECIASSQTTKEMGRTNKEMVTMDTLLMIASAGHLDFDGIGWHSRTQFSVPVIYQIWRGVQSPRMKRSNCADDRLQHSLDSGEWPLIAHLPPPDSLLFLPNQRPLGGRIRHVHGLFDIGV